jgi:hypothetical protein
MLPRVFLPLDPHINSDQACSMAGSNWRALADRLKQPKQRVGGPLLLCAILGMPATDRVCIFN